MWSDGMTLFPRPRYTTLLIVCCSCGGNCFHSYEFCLHFKPIFIQRLLDIYAASQQQFLLYTYKVIHTDTEICTVQSTQTLHKQELPLTFYCTWMTTPRNEHSCSSQLVSYPKPAPDVAVTHLLSDSCNSQNRSKTQQLPDNFSQHMFN